MFLPVTFLGMYAPFAIRLLLRSAQRSGRVSGTVYGVSTAGSIFGTLGTTFFLIPAIGARAITLALGLAGLIAGLMLLGLAHLARRAFAMAALLPILLVSWSASPCFAQGVIDTSIRASLLARPDGRITHIETAYNDVFITKRQRQLVMSFQIKGWDYTESVIDLADPDDLPLPYARVMTVAIIYPSSPQKILMLGLGGGTSTFPPRSPHHHG